MSETERKEVMIRYENRDTYEAQNPAVHKIITDDEAYGEFIMQPSFPPILHPPPMTAAGIEKLQALEGVIVQVK